MNKTLFHRSISFVWHPLAALLIISITLVNETSSQSSSEVIRNMVSQYKNDVRGPYKDIRWFCKDGSVIPPREKCKEPGGYQRARYKDEVVRLGETNHIYLGQILMGTDKEAFYDQPNDYSRMKQYVVENYLYAADDGWINRKGKFYRGAVQAEDEEVWGGEFLTWALNGSRFSTEKYFLIREMAKFVPHGEQSNLVLSIRTLSKNISDRNPSFMDLRTKIHGSPSKGDLAQVKKFKTDKAVNWKGQDLKELDDLIAAMGKYYSVTLRQQINPLIRQLPSGSIKDKLNTYAEISDQTKDLAELVIRSADILESLRREIEGGTNPKTRLTLMDLSIAIEQASLMWLSDWQPEVLKDKLKRTCYLSQLSYATGYLYEWEYDEVKGALTSLPQETIPFEDLIDILRTVRKNINWGSALIYTEFGHVVEEYSKFEPITESFMDDRIRSSALLYMGQVASQLNDLIADKAGWQNAVFGKKSSTIQGINPGLARGRLIVLDQLDEENVDPSAIYVFRKSPPDLQPVAGILSISEGNMVSHLQLLARNLGIPNSNISESDYTMLKNYADKEIFYAVSNRGGVVIKPGEDMTEEEKQLFIQRKVDEEVIAVPTDDLLLSNPKVYALEDVDASSSGKLCGPKAANFGRLKKLFPDHLVDGLVIPFSVFRDHMDQSIPGKQISYWSHLTETFEHINKLKGKGRGESEIEKYTFERLEELRNLIKVMPLKQTFVNDLEGQFTTVFGKGLGEFPVFLRSDTNMEDLKDFTGAGLNLTVFNTISRDKILQGIRDVWASPYSERSYRWRQKFLTNPLDVYPSILVIPSVFVDYSGVIITKDFIEGTEGRLNVAFSQGAGGAVDGQKSESWILDSGGKNILVSPARDRKYKYLSKEGGTASQEATLSTRILTEENIKDIWRICRVIYEEMPKAGMAYPYDIELGFEKGKLWLFQIRPFVENKKAVSSFYLSKLDPVIPDNVKIDLNEKIIQ